MGSAYFDAHSLWQRADKPLFTSLRENTKVDVCIIGAGIAGLTTAYQLLKAGKSVVVLERERLGLGETGLTSAHLSNALDEGYVAIQRMHGVEGAKLAAESHAHAIDLIEQIQADENIDCEFKRVSGYLFLGESDRVEDLQSELEACHASGLKNVRLLESAPTSAFQTGPCLEFPNQAQFHPLRYLDGLAEVVQKLGGAILTHSEVTEFKGGWPAYVKTTLGFQVECESIVIATNVPLGAGLSLHSKNAANRSYVIGLLVPPEKASAALFWDMAKPYHYMRFVKDPTNGEDILLVGGEDHRTGQGKDPEEHFKRLQSWAKLRLGLESRVVTRWSGQILEPVDGLAYIGRKPGDQPNVFIVTGDSGHGLTHGTLAGTLLRDLILGKENPWAKVYEPSRLHFRSLSTYAKQAAQSAVPYSDWLAEGDVSSPDDIERDHGAVIREGLRKVAVYKDEGGRLHSCSAVCPHLGGLVRWNSAEKTWDCPCHGSRFDRFGQVLNGPAQQPLAPLEEGLPMDGEALPL